MGKKLLLAAILTTAIAAPSFAGVFADVPFDHWAYSAVEELAQAGVLEGYPDGTFKGKQPMTRYEFAVACERAYKRIMAAMPPAGMTQADLEAWFRQHRNELMGPKGDKGDAGAGGAAGAAGRDGKDGAAGAPGAQGATGPQGPEGKIPTEWLTRLDNLERRLINEFAPELKSIGAQVEAMLARLTALESKVSALGETVASNTSRIEALEKFRWFGGVTAGIGLDGSAGLTPLGPVAGLDGDLKFEAGEAFSYLSLKAGIDANLGGDMRGRFSWWYDSDGNQHHGALGTRNGGNVHGLAEIGIDEAWVRLPAVGGRWIFGRQYAGQDYETGESNPMLGMGTGYYTGAALTGIKGMYDLGNYVDLTVLAQADDNNVALGNMAGVARVDIDVPWFKTGEGDPLFEVGFQTVGHYPGGGFPVATILPRGFNSNTYSTEWSFSADLMVNVLKGLHVEYTNQVRQANGLFPDLPFALGGDANTDSEGQAIYGTLGILDTPTFTLDVAGGLVEQDFNLGDSILTNPYVSTASAAFALFDRPVILSPKVQNFGPSQGFDIHLTWNIGDRPLALRWAGSTLNNDSFNWMVYASIPVVQTSNGNITVGGGYVDVEDGTGLAPAHALGGPTTAVRVQGGFNF